MEDLLVDSLELVEKARARNILLRVAGSVGVALLSQEDLSRRPFPIKDLDLATEMRFRRSVQAFLAKEGWELVLELLAYSDRRESYISAQKGYSIDLYYDEIDGNHCVSIRGRLNLSTPTIPVTDLLLSKLQRVNMRPQDVWDCCSLLTTFNGLYVDERFGISLGSRWGLFTTVISNLERLRQSCSNSAAVALLIENARNCPKSLRWRARSLVGRRLKWWREVYETRVTGGAGA